MHLASLLCNGAIAAVVVQVGQAAPAGATASHVSTEVYTFPAAPRNPEPWKSSIQDPEGSNAKVTVSTITHTPSYTRSQTNKKLNALASTNERLVAEWRKAINQSTKAELWAEIEANEEKGRSIAIGAYQAQLRYVNEAVGQLPDNKLSTPLTSLNSKLVYTWPETGLGKAPSQQELSGNGIILY